MTLDLTAWALLAARGVEKSPSLEPPCDVFEDGP
jgi:hypothetical protein